jgi:hypothetical protein
VIVYYDIALNINPHYAVAGDDKEAPRKLTLEQSIDEEDR